MISETESGNLRNKGLPGEEPRNGEIPHVRLWQTSHARLSALQPRLEEE